MLPPPQSRHRIFPSPQNTSWYPFAVNPSLQFPQTADCISVPTILPLPEYYINGIVQNTAFCVRFLALSIMLLSVVVGCSFLLLRPNKF